MGTGRLVVGISGASGIARGMRVLELALFGEGIEVTAAETVGLPVPATAEIVIEGHAAVDETAIEGPMNEYPGYNSSEASRKPVFAIRAVSWRDGAILPVVAAGPPIEEDHTVTGTMHVAELLYQFHQAGLPATLAWVCVESAWHWLIVAIQRDWPEAVGGHSGKLPRRIGEVAFAGKAGFGVPNVLVVEDDIDITDVNEVMWAFATRSHPEHGEVHFAAEPTQVAGEGYLDEAELHSYQAGKVVYNCLLADRLAKEDRPVRGGLQNGWPREIQLRVLDRWTTEYGYRAQAGREPAASKRLRTPMRNERHA